MNARPFVTRREDAPGFVLPGESWRLLASGARTAGAFCLLERRFAAPGDGACTHADAQGGGFYVARGRCTVAAGGERFDAGPGTFVSLPARTERSFVVQEPGTRLLDFRIPAGIEMIAAGLSVPAAEPDVPSRRPVPAPPRATAERLSRDHGRSPTLGLPGIDAPTARNTATHPTPDAAALPFVAQAATSPSFWQIGGLWSVLADAKATEARFSVIEQRMPPGPQAPPHLHETMDEVFVVLEGRVEMLLGDRIDEAGEGALIFIPRGTVHGFRVVGERPARVLNLYTPAGFERSVTELASPARAMTLPPGDFRPPDVAPERRAALFDAIGMRPVAVPDPFARRRHEPAPVPLNDGTHARP